MSKLLIDTNLLMVAVVAAVDPSQVERVGRTQAYSVADAALLDGVVREHENVVVTPQILTEVSNLLTVGQPLLGSIRARLAELVPRWIEHTTSSSDLVGDPFFHRFGITDAAISRACGSAVAVLTDDLPLYDALGRRGYKVINFTHVRTRSWRETLAWQ